jgi:hypothetical protein
LAKLVAVPHPIQTAFYGAWHGIDKDRLWFLSKKLDSIVTD